MFRDTKEELARLEAELLAAEEPEEEEYDEASQEEDFDEEYEDGYEEDYGEDWDDEPEQYRAYNTDITDEDLDAYAESVRTPGKSGPGAGLVILLCLLTLGIVAMVALFLRREGLL